MRGVRCGAPKEFECVFVQHGPSSLLSFIHKHYLLFSISISIPFLSISILRCHRYCRLWYSVIKANEQRILFFVCQKPEIAPYYSSIPQVLIQGSRKNGSHSSSRRPTSERQFSIKFGKLACERPSPSARAISCTSPFRQCIKFYRLESRTRSDRK